MPRLDIHLVEIGLCRSRHQAKLLIQSGQIYVDGVLAKKVSRAITNQTVTLADNSPRYVSRGGNKLAHAFSVFNIDLDGLCCVDIGSSTGGFTDCCLKHGAIRVYAIDVGHGQLHSSLHNDNRVVAMEGTNIRTLSSLPEPVDFASCDVSFCSATLILPHIYALQPKQSVILIKPQFEVGPQGIRKGRVRSEAIRQEAIEHVKRSAADLGFIVKGCCDSPIIGAKKGNIESLMWLECPSY